VLSLGVIELARTMSRRPRARSGHILSPTISLTHTMVGVALVFPPTASPSALSCRSISHNPYQHMKQLALSNVLTRSS